MGAALAKHRKKQAAHSLQASDIDSNLNAVNMDEGEAPGKLSCWQHLMATYEVRNMLDFIIIDLNPAANKMNYLAMLW